LSTLEDEKRLDMAASLAERNSLVCLSAFKIVDTNGDDSRTTASSADLPKDSTSRPGNDLSMRIDSASRSGLAANTISDDTRLPDGSKMVDRELSPRATYVSGVEKKVASEATRDAAEEEEEEEEEACKGEDPGDGEGELFSGLNENINEASNFAVCASAVSGEMSCASAGRRVDEKADDCELFP